ncbi:hypothetical protein GCM10010401_13830 [Rarobacter faecitabidus]|uniref:Uncharacterized protein n=1 Tax=Rarobacter faecitabidus TaxID=13243 RepID=A0A542ZE57_RARFA|nr:restriction endonuclease [Rarobacter faecitabidus]TQL58569.1 hypothetical protein FB461_1984 [Rarobacter faecitabidus]
MTTRLGLPEWDRLGQKDFDRYVDLILRTEHHDLSPSQAYSPDGRGGDRGIDFIARGPLGFTTIYQYKYFHEGIFRASKESRKRQIRESFAAALKYSPQRWVLVVPCKVTLNEREFIQSLNGSIGTPEIQIMDQVELNHLVSSHPSILKSLQGGQLKATLSELGLDGAIPDTTEGLVKRIAAVEEVFAVTDPYWGVRTSSSGSERFIECVPKREDSFVASPIQASISLDESAATDAEREAYRSGLGLGKSGTFEFPAITQKLSGPDFLDIDGETMVRVVRAKAPQPHLQASLEFARIDGEAVQFDAQIEHFDSGPFGTTVELDLYGALHLTVSVPLGPGASPDIRAEVNLVGQLIRDAAPALNLFEKLLDPATKISLVVNGTHLVSNLSPALASTMDQADLSTLFEAIQYAEDLEHIERSVHGAKRMPTTFTGEDRLVARIVRLLLDGQCVLMPQWFQFNGTFTSDLPSKENKGIWKQLNGGAGLRVSGITSQVSVGGISLELGPLMLYCPETTIANHALLEPKMRRGQLGGERLQLKASPDQPWRAILSDSFASYEADDRLIPTPWSAVGIPDHRLAVELNNELEGSAEARDQGSRRSASD